MLNDNRMIKVKVVANIEVKLGIHWNSYIIQIEDRVSRQKCDFSAV